ncbi:transcription intermediary factor 1-alpha-like [Mercenaria mercenaria]|uniref:transcription intermediary factor 1-alpha-like n=1 Tax=Mercenaria mercenaria TaxID=6596 RepID=UPI00234E4DC6|nr:transcription intermediary factor 1-alpha-like [Mercenaria mercenaria]XP_053388408.1 transcription intermediary factor 1-alpha-like [Mercenaria mercenaria]
MEVSGKLAEGRESLKLCEHCQFVNITTKANGICRECEEYMCDTCFRNHLKGKRNRNHELIDMNDPDISAWKSAEDVEKCKQHDNEAIKFYCRKHEIVGCGDCIILEHSTCKPEYIKDLSKNLQETEDFIHLKRKIEQLERENKTSYENVQKNRKHCKVVHEEVLTKIRKFRTDINIYLDKAEADIISEMEQLMSDNDKLLDKLDNDCAKYLSEIEGLKQKLDPTVHRENVLFIQTVRSKASVLEIEHKLSKNVQSACELKGYKFVPYEKLSSIIKSREKLGKINISNINESKQDEFKTLEMNIDTLTLQEPKKQKPRKPEQQETDSETAVKPPPVFVGTRVQPINWSLYHRGKPGTVTAVRPDGTVDVKWDYLGATGSGYRVGTGPKGIRLI